MKTKPQLWTNLRSGLWFLPTTIVVSFTLFALALTQFDRHFDHQVRGSLPAVLTRDPDSARELLSTISSSIVTVAGVVFSITIVTLALASSQYSSRTVRAFTRDTLNQAVLGAMVGTFAYCTTVLLTISGSEGTFVPSLAVFTGYLLSIAAVLALIVFIHHVTTSIQASGIIASIAEDTLAAVDQTFAPAASQPSSAEQSASAPPDVVWTPVPSRRTGYVVSVDVDALTRFAARNMGIVRMDHSAGDFITAGKPLLSVSLRGAADPAQIAELTRSHRIGRFRTVDQDPDFGVRQIVDVALKALSPGVNDTTTAVMCVDHLSAILIDVGSRRERQSICKDGKLLVVLRGPSFEGLASKAYNQIRQNAQGNVGVITALLNSIEMVADSLPHSGRREALAQHVRSLAELVQRSIESPYDRAEVNEHVARVAQKLQVSLRA